MTTLTPGSLVQDQIGHWYQIVSGGPWQYVCQPLTTVGTELRALGGTVRMGRSDLRIN
jgi:hypothetical protein